MGVFISGACVGGNISPAREGSFPLALFEKGNKVGSLEDASLVGKGIERPLLPLGNTGSSLAKDLGVSELAFPHLKPTDTTRSERGEDEHVCLGGRRTVAAASLLRDA